MFKILTICAFWCPKPQDNHQGWMAGRSEKKSIERSNESSVSTLQSIEKWSNQTITLQKSSPKRVTCFLIIICSATRLLDLNCVCKLPCPFLANHATMTTEARVTAVEGCGSIERCSFKKAATAPGLWAVLTPGGSTCWMVWGRSFCLGKLTWIFSGTQVTHASFHMENGGIFGRARLTPCIVGMFAGIFFLLLMLQKSARKPPKGWC